MDAGDYADLRRAKELLENPGLAARMDAVWRLTDGVLALER